MAQPVVVFDVNETLLDLRALDPAFERVFGDAAARRDWFKQLLQLSLIANVLDAYRDFTALGRASLEMIAFQRGIALGEEQKHDVASALRTLPAHDDVQPALARLHDAGFRLATLTNSTGDAVEAQLRHAGIRDAFATVLSVDAVRRFKPAAETYRMAAERLGTSPAGMVLVAAHGWDVWGAMRAGAAAAFVARPGQGLIPGAPEPSIVAASLGEVADELIRRATA